MNRSTKLISIASLLVLGFVVFKLVGLALASLALIPIRFYKFVLAVPLLILAGVLYFDYSENAERRNILDTNSSEGVVQELPLQSNTNRPFTLQAHFHIGDDPYLDLRELPRFYRGIFKPVSGCEYEPLGWYYTFKELELRKLLESIAQATVNECGFVEIKIDVVQRSGALTHQRSVLRNFTAGNDVTIVEPTRKLSNVRNDPAYAWPDLSKGNLKRELVVWADISIIALAIFFVSNLLGLPKKLKSQE